MITGPGAGSGDTDMHNSPLYRENIRIRRPWEPKLASPRAVSYQYRLRGRVCWLESCFQRI